MKDDRKTKKQLISELEELRQRIAKLEGADPERVQIQDALRKSEQRFRTSIEGMLDCFGIYTAIRDHEGRIVDFLIEYVNEAACVNNRMTREEQVGKQLCELLPAHIETGLFDEYCHLVETGRPLLKTSLIYEDTYKKEKLIRAFAIRATKLGDGFAIAWRDVSEHHLAEQALQESEERYRDLFENAPNAYFSVGMEGIIRKCNKHAVEMLGYAVEDLVGRPVSDLYTSTPHGKEKASQLFEKFRAGEEIIAERLQMQRADGTPVWINLTVNAVRDDQGQIVESRSMAVDITEQVQAADVLRESKERYHQLFETVSDAIMVFDADTRRFIDVNQRTLQLYGYSRDEFLKLAQSDITAEPEESDRTIQEVLEGDIDRIPLRYHKKKDGTLFPVEISGSTLTLHGREMLCGVVRDISHRFKAEELLRESEERYRKISALSSDFAASYWIGPDGTQKVEWATEAFLRIMGYSPEEIAAGGGINSIAHPEDKEILERRQRDLLTGKPVTSEYRILTKSGEVVWLRDYAMSDWGVPEGRVVRIYGAAEDITERKLAEKELEDIFNLSPNMVGVFTTEGKLLKVNPAWETVLGYSQKELLDLGWTALVHPDDVEITNKEVEKQLKGSTVANFVNRYKCKDGSYKSLEWQASFAKEGIVHATARDITERLASERALEQSEIRYRSLFENMLNGFVYCKLILDKDEDIADIEILEVNEVFETSTGISREQVAGMKLSEVVPGLREANPELFDKYGKALLEEESIEFEEYLAPLDQWVHVMVFSPEEGYAMAIFEDISARKQAEEELKQNAERLATLREIDQAILAAKSPSDIAKSAIDQLGKLVGAERISVTLFDFLNEVNIISSVQVPDRTEIGVGARIPLRDFVMGEELEQGLVHRVDEIETLEHPSPVDIQLLREGVKSYINVPLMVQNKLTGSLNLGASEKGAFTEGLIEIACEVANSLAIALQQARLFEQVKFGRDRLQLLSRRLVEGQEAERRFIAQELHDEVGQVLTSLKLSLQMSKERLPDLDSDEFKETEDLIDILLKQVRDLSLDLRPAMLDDLGLLPALLWQLERFEGQTGIEVIFEHSGLADRQFLPEIETAAYRIVQEALTNVARHAQVTNVEVHTHYGNELLTIEIADEGVGFDVANSHDVAASLGLVGMEERATMLGGSINFESVAGKGTNVRAEIPLGAPLERRGTERVK